MDDTTTTNNVEDFTTKKKEIENKKLKEFTSNLSSELSEQEGVDFVFDVLNKQKEDTLGLIAVTYNHENEPSVFIGGSLDNFAAIGVLEYIKGQFLASLVDLAEEHSEDEF